MTSDISVVHAPDFSYWRWIELGNPYYESSEPTGNPQFLASIQEDYDAIGRGFNLHKPVVNSKKRVVDISFNIFEPGRVVLEVFKDSGEKVASLFNGLAKNIGIYKLTWKPEERPGKPLRLIMKYGSHTQIRDLSSRSF